MDMHKETTKQRIVTEAVKLFSKNGYEAVTVEQIATAVGIKAPSLYKHYKGKRDIFEAILERMNQMDYERAKEYEMPEGTMDEFSSSFRKMLTIEQFRSKDMSDLYQQYLGAGPIEYMSNLFARMTKDAANSMSLALAFYSPMFLLYSMYDAASNSEGKKKITDMLRKHIEQLAKRLTLNMD